MNNLHGREWKEFKLNHIFPEIKRGKRLKKDNHIKGNIPYVSATALNNGTDDFIGNAENVRKFERTLTIANSGSVGAVFYHPFQIIASDHVTKLENKSFERCVYLFLAAIASRLGEKYSFNREMSDARIKKEKILLPVNSKSEPDYDYMERYIQHLEHQQIERWINFTEVKQETQRVI